MLASRDTRTEEQADRCRDCRPAADADDPLRTLVNWSCRSGSQVSQSSRKLPARTQRQVQFGGNLSVCVKLGQLVEILTQM